MLRQLFAVTIVIGLGLIGIQNTGAQTSAQRVVNGLSSGLYLTHAPGETDRVFLLEQNTGRIRTMDLNTGSLSTFMTITGMQTGGERGLLGLAFDPNYQTNGHFYTYSTHSGRSEVRRYTATGTPGTATSASPATKHDILRFNQPFSNHNGGWIGFNPKDEAPYLYIASGDGGSGGDPQNNAQDITNNRLGKMLRVDVSGDDFASLTENYSVPASNPFVGVTGDDEIWAYGLRNPWRNSFDPDTGDLWIGDVGQNAREEIDHEPFGSGGGLNYGWKIHEGNNCFSNVPGNLPCNDPSLVFPVHTYGHNGAGGFSTTGGYVYRGSASEFEGLYFFGDFGTDNIWTLDPYAQDMSASVINRNSDLPTNTSSINGIASFGEDGSGELYIVSYNNGSVFRISSTSADAVWNGDAATGTAGNGSGWNDANNWTRGGNVDSAMVAQDRVIFGPGSSTSVINLQGNRTAGAVEFQADYFLVGSTLKVLSGNVRVNSGVVAGVNSGLVAETSNASIRKRGAGRLNIESTAGQIVVLEGTLGGSGSAESIRVYSGAKVSPGEVIGTLITGRYEQLDGATLEIQLALTSDVLMVTGQATIDGDLEIDGTGYVPAARGTVEDLVILSANGLNGTFDNVDYDGVSLVPNGNEHVGNGVFVNLAYSSSGVTLTNYFALFGDANGDLTVDGQDFLIWNVNKFSDGTDWSTGDFNGDGMTDGADFLLWNQFKFTSVDLATVPEPMGAGIVLFGLLSLSRFRRR